MSALSGKTVLMMAGGTGGHVYPALAVAKLLRASGCDVHWVGTRHGLEARVVPEADLPLHTIAVRGLRGKGMWQKIQALGAMIVSTGQALFLLLRIRPRCVIGMGGYVAAPAGIAAWLLRKPLVIHEQNAVAGTTNRLLAPLATKILSAFQKPFGERDVECVGNPVRQDIVSAGLHSRFDFTGQRPLRLLIVGGSLGAQALNDAVPSALRRLCTQLGDDCIAVRHQTGPMHYDVVERRYGRKHDHDWKLLPYIENMANAYRWADLVLCRAGALTVSELAVVGRPSILVPLPNAIDDHQRLNAQALADNGAALVVEQDDLSAAFLSQQLQLFIEQPDVLQSMALAAHDMARPDAATRVVQICEEVCSNV